MLLVLLFKVQQIFYVCAFLQTNFNGMIFDLKLIKGMTEPVLTDRDGKSE